MSGYTQGPEIIPQTGHSAAINFICFSADNQFLASLDKNNVLILWSLPLKRQFFSYQLNNLQKINAVFFSSDNKKIFIEYRNQNTVSLELKTLKFNQQETNVDRNLKKKTEDVIIDHFLIKRKGKFNKVSNNIDYEFTSFAISGKKDLLFAANEDSRIYIFRYSDGKNMGQLEGHVAPVRDVAVSVDEKYIASAGDDRSIIVRTSDDLKIYCHLFTRVFRLTSLDINDEGNRVAIGDESGGISVLKLDLGQFMVKNYQLHKSEITSMQFSKDDKWLFSGSSDLSATIVNLETEKLRKRLYYHSGFLKFIDLNNPLSLIMQLFEIKKRIDFLYRINTVAISPDAKLFAFSGLTEGYFLKDKIALYNIETNSRTKILLSPHQISKITDIHFADNKTLIARENNSTMHVWEKGPFSLPFYVKSEQPSPQNLSSLLLPDDRNVFIYYNEQYQKGYSFQAFQKNEKTILSINGNQAQLSGSSRTPVTLTGHTGQITGIDLFPDKNLVVTSGSDASVKLWNKITGELLATLYIIDNQYSILITPDNYYLTQRGGLDGISFKIGDNLYLPEQFDLKYNRPDLVLKNLGLVGDDLIDVYHKAYLKRLKKMNFTEEMLGSDFHLPEIKLIDKNKLELKTQSNTIKLKVEAFDSKYKLDRINVWINNVAVFGKEGIDLRKKNVSQATEEFSIELIPGENNIQISVMNQKGAESLMESFKMECEIPMEKPVLYIVAFGVSNFKDSRFNLQYAAKDAMDFCQLFSAQKGLYKDVKIKTLLNEQFTKSALKEVKDFLMHAERNDIVMVFVAGHGLLDENLDYFYASYDIDFNNPAAKGIAYDEIEWLLDGLKALKKILFMDTCHSGEVDKDEVEKADEKQEKQDNIVFRNVGTGIRQKEATGIYNTSELMKEMFTDLHKGTGANVISSSGGAEFSMESSDWKNGLFTYVLIDGLKNKHADLNHDGKVFISELRNYISTKVTELSGGKQIPNTRAENMRFDYQIW